MYQPFQQWRLHRGLSNSSAVVGYDTAQSVDFPEHISDACKYLGPLFLPYDADTAKAQLICNDFIFRKRAFKPRNK